MGQLFNSRPLSTLKFGRGHTMNEIIKIRYTFQHNDTGRLTQKIFSIEDIEEGRYKHWKKSIGKRYYFTRRDRFTTRHDKNNREIYEGDDVKFFYNSEERIEAVIFLGGSFSLGWCMSLLDTGTDQYRTELEIVDNPELLK